MSGFSRLGSVRMPVSRGQTLEIEANSGSSRNAVRCGMQTAWLPTEPLPYSFQIGCMFPISVMIRFSASGPGLPFVDDIVEHSQLGGSPRKDEALDVGIQRDCAIRWYVSRDRS